MSAIPGSCASTGPCSTVSAASGFDPARWQWESGPCVNRFGQVTSYDICHPREPGSPGVCVVASCYEGEAVARFIAAAPRLYAALQAAVEDATGKPNVWFFDAKDALAAATASDEELRRFGFWRGHYENICLTCGSHFVGAKNTPRCWGCCYASAIEARRAETPKSGSVHESASDAQPLSPLSKDNPS